jgi:hypothetical protein
MRQRALLPNTPHPFLAPDDEVPHILSGDLPNSFPHIYKAVNEAILEGRGEMTEVKPGLVSGEFRMIANLNDGDAVARGVRVHRSALTHEHARFAN